MEPGVPSFNTYRKLSIPPLFGRPQQKNVDIPTSTPANLWFVALDDDNLKALKIQTVPLELSVEPEPNWVTIPSIGRNNPFYHYTGGEDTLRFTIDWYSVRQDRSDVIENCRWIEGLSKADGYYKGPSRVLLIWGSLFRSDAWIVKSAPYRLSIFDKELGVMPRQAYQEVTLCKVTDHNTTREEIRFQR